MRWALFSCLALLTCTLPHHAGRPSPELTSTAAEATAPKVQATIYSADRCVPCRRYVDAVQREMPPDGWIVRDATAPDAMKAHVIITKTAVAADKIEAYPTTIIRRDGREVDRIVGQITPTKLAQAINKQLR